MKRTVALLLTVLFVVLLVSCGHDGENMSAERSDTIGESKLADVSSAASVQESEAEESPVLPESSVLPTVKQKVVFMGNSLTKCSAMPYKLEVLSAGKYNVYDLSMDGAFLQTHLERLEARDDEYIKTLTDADIVVLQEYGGGFALGVSMTESGKKQLQSIVSHIKELASDEVKIYFMLPHVIYAYGGSKDSADDFEIKGIKEFGGLIPLPLGLICQFVFENYYSDINDFLYDGLHPSEVDAAYAAMAFQIIVDGMDKPTDKWKKMYDGVIDALPGKTMDEKLSAVAEIYSKAYEYYQTVSEKYSIE